MALQEAILPRIGATSANRHIAHNGTDQLRRWKWCAGSRPPKTISAEEITQKLGLAEAAAKEVRFHYTYQQDVLIQTRVDSRITGEFHEVKHNFLRRERKAARGSDLR
jgi:hypothetical protein